MSDRLLNVLLIEPDSILRTGLRVRIEESLAATVVAEVENIGAALQVLAESTNDIPASSQVDLVVLEFLDRFQI